MPFFDWLAERYVELVARADFFVANPTACRWIDALQIAGLGLLALAAARTGVFAAGARCLGATAEEASLGSLPRRSRRRLAGALAIVQRAGRTGARTVPVRLVEGPASLVVNVGLLRPVVLVSRRAVALLDRRELAAALAHEVEHGVRRDNLHRVALDAACFATPALVWAASALPLSVGSPAAFVSTAALGAAAGLGLRLAVAPLVAYWQERRADERAAFVLGDRLAVASALLKVAASSEGDPAGRLAWASTFALYRRPVVARVRRLLDPRAGRLLAVDRVVRSVFRVARATSIALAAIAVLRAETGGLEARVVVERCQPSVVVAHR